MSKNKGLVSLILLICFLQICMYACVFYAETFRWGLDFSVYSAFISLLLVIFPLPLLFILMKSMSDAVAQYSYCAMVSLSLLLAGTINLFITYVISGTINYYDMRYGYMDLILKYQDGFVLLLSVFYLFADKIGQSDYDTN